MQTQTDVQFITDGSGQQTAVLVPIDMWREILAERETAYLLQNPAMRRRLLDAMKGTAGISIEDVCAKLGV